MTCVLYNWVEYFECSWQHPVPYNMKLNDTIVTSSLNSSYSNDLTFPCPNQTFHGCRWPRVVESINYTVHVNVINTKTKDMASTLFPVLPKNEVKPSAPKNINIHALDENDCFNITWQHDKINSSLIYKILHQSSEDSGWNETASNLHQKSWKICGLKPFTSHNFSIVCQAKYFSDPSNYSYTTPQKAPLSGPEAMNGSYISEECTQESVNRNVTLFWKDVKETEKNGIIKRFIIKYKNIEMSVEKEKYFTTLNLPCNSQETVKLFAENDAGHSLNPTMLTIAPHFFKVPQEMKNSFSVELTNASSVQAIWQNDDYNNSKRFTVFWLEDFVEGSIKGPVYWKHVPKNHTSISLSLTKPLLFKVGLVISDDNLGWTSPIEWTDCFYEPSSLPTIVEIDVRPSQESVIIIWEKIECNKLSKIKITDYTIQYCPAEQCNNKEDIKTLQISPAESSYILTQLIPNTSYKLAAYARAGDKKGPMSEWKQFSTKEKFYELIYLCILLIPFSGVICLFIIICYKSRKRIQKLNSNHETCSEPVMKSTTIAEMQTEYCELSNLATDSASPLLNPSDIRPQKSGQFFDDGGETSVLLKDLIQRDVHSDTKYSTAISIVENSMTSSKEVCANERKCKAPDSNNKVEECSDYIKVNELHELDYLTNVLVEDDIPGTVLSETLRRAQSAQIL